MSERYLDTRQGRDALDRWLTTPPEERFDYGPQFDEGEDEPECIGCEDEPLVVITTFDKDGNIKNTMHDSLSEWPALYPKQEGQLDHVEFHYQDGSVQHVSRMQSHM